MYVWSKKTHVTYLQRRSRQFFVAYVLVLMLFCNHYALPLSNCSWKRNGLIAWKSTWDTGALIIGINILLRLITRLRNTVNHVVVGLETVLTALKDRPGWSCQRLILFNEVPMFLCHVIGALQNLHIQVCNLFQIHSNYCRLTFTAEDCLNVVRQCHCSVTRHRINDAM